MIAMRQAPHFVSHFQACAGMLVVVITALAGCTWPSPQPATFVPQHRVEVHPQTALLSLPSRDDEVTLTRAEEFRLDQYLSAFLDRHSGALDVMASGNTRDILFAQRVVDHAARRGIPTSWIKLDEAAPGAVAGAILLRYHAFVVDVPDCGDWRTESSGNFHNTPHPNQGCALTRNIALMAADPADLTRRRPIGASDSQRLNLLLQQYRAGELDSGGSSEESESSGETAE